MDASKKSEIKSSIETLLTPDEDMNTEQLQILMNAQTQYAIKLAKEHLEALMRKRRR